MVALIPLPAILLHARFEPLQMLATIVVLAVGVGIVYPVWWRSKHHPGREDGREKRARRIAVVCRTVAFASLVGVMVSWVVGSNVSFVDCVSVFATGTGAFIVGLEVEERWTGTAAAERPKLRPTRNLSRADIGDAGPAKGDSLEGSVLRFGAELGHRRVWIALFRAVKLRDSPKMNFGERIL